MSYEEFLAALCLWREARGCSLPCLTAIWWVIQNRAMDSRDRWPKSIPGVILQHAQFSSFTAGDPNATKFPMATPIGNADWAAWLDCMVAVTTSLGPDPTNGGTNYESIPDPAERPAWADPSKITLELGPFRFYKL